MRIDAPFLHRHRPDQVRREARLRLERFLGGQTPVWVRLLQRLEAVVDLHRGLHSLDVVPVVRQDWDQEHNPVDEVAGDRDDVAGVLSREPCGVPVELEVARPAVDHPARRAGRARTPIALFQEKHRKPAQREVARDSRAGDTTANHNYVVRA